MLCSVVRLHKTVLLYGSCLLYLFFFYFSLIFKLNWNKICNMKYSFLQVCLFPIETWVLKLIQAEYYTVVSLTTIYAYDYFKSILLPVNFSKGIFGYNQHCVDFGLVIIQFFKKHNISRKKYMESVFSFSCALCYLANEIPQEACF